LSPKSVVRVIIGRCGTVPSLEDKKTRTAKLMVREGVRQDTEVMGGRRTALALNVRKRTVIHKIGQPNSRASMRGLRISIP
jgi:hypothetical protein